MSISTSSHKPRSYSVVKGYTSNLIAEKNTGFKESSSIAITAATADQVKSISGKSAAAVARDLTGEDVTKMSGPTNDELLIIQNLLEKKQISTS